MQSNTPSEIAQYVEQHVKDARFITRTVQHLQELYLLSITPYGETAVTPNSQQGSTGNARGEREDQTVPNE